MCRQMGLRIPDQVALLGVDNDELECRLTSPPLSSVENPSERIGYEAARLLDRLMGATPPTELRISIPAPAVVTRQSTDTLAVEDQDMGRAMAFIREHACGGLSVSEVADHIALSRRMLERRFRQLLGRSVLQEIRNVRIGRARELLLKTDLPMPEIARRCGFSSPQRLAVVFGKIVGEVPTAFRRRGRMDPSGKR
jgi:LacI family transcriptional regulator